MSGVDGCIARSQSHIVTVRLICTAEAEECVLDFWRLGTRGRREKVTKEEAE